MRQSAVIRVTLSLAVLVIVFSFFLLSSTAQTDRQHTIVTIAMVVILVTARFMAQSIDARWAAAFGIFGIAGVLLWRTWAFAGLDLITISVFIVLMLGVGVLLGSRWGVVFGVGAIFAVSGIIGLTVRGVIPPPYLGSYVLLWWEMMTVLLVCIGLVYYAVGGFERALQQSGRANAELARREIHFRSLIENSASVVMLLDDAGFIKYMSPSVVRVLGYGETELIGHNRMDYLHPDDQPVIREVMAGLLKAQHQTVATTVRFRHQDGSWRWIEAIGANMLNEPSVDALVINFHDVTATRLAAEALQHAQKLESLGVMAGGVAHDFNNLLTAMLVQAALAEARLEPDSPAHRNLAKIVTAAERAADLTRQMLAYSGRGHFAIQSLDLNALIEENFHLFAVAVPKNVTFQSTLAPCPVRVDADPGQLQQVVMNLIINAAESMQETGGLVTIITDVVDIGADVGSDAFAVGEQLLPGPHAKLTVSDTGVGMDRATLGRIFDPFFTTKGSGRGLGLAAAVGIIRTYNGRLEVASTAGQGTVFQLFFPLSSAQDQLVDTAGIDHEQPLPPATLLIIDDEEPLRQAVEDIFFQTAVHVLAAADGESGIALFAQHQQSIDLVLLDLSMPGMNGRETYRVLRQIDDKVRVIFSSGYSADETQSTEDSVPGVFLQKPYHPQQLRALVREQLSLRV